MMKMNIATAILGVRELGLSGNQSREKSEESFIVTYSNILSQIDSYTSPISVADQNYVPPLRQTFTADHDLLRILRGMSAPNTPGVSLMEKVDRSDDGHATLAMRDALMKQPAWPGFMSFIWRDAPDARGKTITFLPNEDTLAVILAVRLGIEVEIAVALAHQDLIYRAQLNIGTAPTPAYHDGALLGTFTALDASTTVGFALFGRKKAATFKTAFRREELILLHQTDDVGLVRGHGSYNSDVLQPLPCRTDEVIWATDLGIGGLSQ